MVWVKIFQIRSSDKAIVFQFYNSKDDTEPFGSRGVNLDDQTFNDIISNITIADFFKYKTEGFELPEEPTTTLEKVAVQSYQEFLNAKSIEEQMKEGVLE